MAPPSRDVRDCRDRKVAHLSSVHAWNDPRIFLKEARSLAAAGYDVTLVAQNPQPEVVDGVRCVGLPAPRNRFERMLLLPWRVLKEARRADICHFHDPELIPVGIVLKLLGKRVVYDAHEDVPRQMQYKYWIPALLRPLLARLSAGLEWSAARILDRIVAATPIIAARFPAAKTIVVQNFPLTGELVVPDTTIYDQRPAQFIYVGSVAEARGALLMVDAIDKLEGHPEARLLLVGRCSPDSLQASMQARPGWSRTSYLGYQGRAEIARLLADARVGLVLLQPVQNLIDAFPTKLFEYMSAGLPIIASDYPICRRVVDDSGVGLLVDPRDSGKVADAMRWMLDHPKKAEEMGSRGPDAVRDRYSWDSEAKKLLAMYDSLG